MCPLISERSRTGEIFHCKDCGIEIDADYNAAINILMLGVYNLQSTGKLTIEDMS